MPEEKITNIGPYNVVITPGIKLVEIQDSWTHEILVAFQPVEVEQLFHWVRLNA